VDIHSHTNGGTHVDGTAEASPLKDAVSATASKHSESLQALKSHLATVESTQHNDMEQLARSTEVWEQIVQERVRAVQQHLEGQLQSMQHQLQESLRGAEQVIAELGEQVAALARRQDDQGRKISNVESAVGGLSHDISTVRTVDLAQRDAKIRDVEGAIDQSRRRQKAAIAAVSVLFILVVAGLVGVQMFGWPGVASWLLAARIG